MTLLCKNHQHLTFLNFNKTFRACQSASEAHRSSVQKAFPNISQLTPKYSRKTSFTSQQLTCSWCFGTGLIVYCGWTWLRHNQSFVKAFPLFPTARSPFHSRPRGITRKWKCCVEPAVIQFCSLKNKTASNNSLFCLSLHSSFISFTFN